MWQTNENIVRADKIKMDWGHGYKYEWTSYNFSTLNVTDQEINVVPRSTGNTNSGTRELTLKCKFKCYFKPMNNPLGVSPSKGKQGTTRGKSKDFFFASCGSLFPFIRANAQWVIHGFKVAKDFFFASCGSLFPFKFTLQG